MTRIIFGVALAVIAAALLLIAACVSPAENSAQVGSAGSFTVERLFEHEGVRVYRFSDGGTYRYYAVPVSGAGATASWSENCGKGCVRKMDMPTTGVER